MGVSSDNLTLNNELEYLAADEPDGIDVTKDELDAIDAKVEALRQALKDRRKAEGLTTREVEARTGATHGTICYIENRSDLSGIRQLMRLAAAYNVELPDLAAAFRASNGSEPAAKEYERGYGGGLGWDFD